MVKYVVVCELLDVFVCFGGFEVVVMVGVVFEVV